jgi:NAD-dependent dihydropyrimidine dehydrogenase PreA subunit
MAEELAVIVSRDRQPGSRQQTMERQLLGALAGRGELAVTVVPHLYDLKPGGPAVEMLRSIRGDMVVLGWLYPRAMYWVLDANRIRGRMGRTALVPEEEMADAPPAGRGTTALPDRTIWCLDLRSQADAGRYVTEIGRLAGVELALPAGEAPPAAAGAEAVHEETVARWYPVIDFARCTNCLECLNFCLFGVFGLGEDEAIVVEEADACRDGCPACSRICPAGAIMFPHHGSPGIAGNGLAVAEELKLDLSQLFAGADPTQLAAAQRDRALAEQRRYAAGQRKPVADPPPARNDLDRLVDEVDDLDL